MRIHRALPVLLLLFAVPAQGAGLSRADALVKLCEVWSTAKFLHPQLMVREVDWDGALLRAIPAAREATTHEELARAVAGMLAEIGDPLTSVSSRSTAKPRLTEIPLFSPHGDVLVVSLGPYADARGGDALFDAGMPVTKEMARYARVVLDVRAEEATTAAQFRRRQVTPFTLYEAGSGYYFEQKLPPGNPAQPRYRGRTIALIDDRAISHAEHTCLFLDVANDTTFVGSNTAGANGDVTNLYLPGGFLVYFTGHDVRHADGRQLQRIGIVPDVSAKPTLAGLRAGRDEVLERALELLK